MTKPTTDWRDEALSRLRTMRAKLAARSAIKREARSDREHLAKQVEHCLRAADAAARTPVLRDRNNEIDASERDLAIERADAALAKARRAVADFDAALEASMPVLDEALLNAAEAAARTLGLRETTSKFVNVTGGRE